MSDPTSSTPRPPLTVAEALRRIAAEAIARQELAAKKTAGRKPSG